MPTQEFAASVQGVAIRVTRLNPDGTLGTGPTDSYTTSAFISVSFTPEYEAGDEITQKAADGTVCITFKAPDTLKRVTMAVSICEPDPEFSALVSGGVLLTRNNANGDARSVGWSSPQTGEDPAKDGVALEVWSSAVVNGKRAVSYPYFYWIFPYVSLALSGDRLIENGLVATTFSGFGLGNIAFADGPDGRWEWPAATDRPYSYARSDWAPKGYRGFYTWGAGGEGTPTVTLTDVSPGINIPGTSTYDPTAPVDYILGSTADAAAAGGGGTGGTGTTTTTTGTGEQPASGESSDITGDDSQTTTQP